MPLRKLALSVAVGAVVTVGCRSNTAYRPVVVNTAPVARPATVAVPGPAPAPCCNGNPAPAAAVPAPPVGATMPPGGRPY